MAGAKYVLITWTDLIGEFQVIWPSCIWPWPIAAALRPEPDARTPGTIGLDITLPRMEQVGGAIVHRIGGTGC
jgi:hypothetical protein